MNDLPSDPKYDLHPVFANRLLLNEYPGFASSALQGAEYHYKAMMEIFNRSFRTADPKSKVVTGPENENFRSEYMQLTWHFAGFPLGTGGSI